MLQKGFVHVFLTVAFLVVGIGALGIASINLKSNNLSGLFSTASSRPQSTQNLQISGTTPDPSLGKKYNFELFHNSGYQYLLEWIGYPKDYFRTNISAPVNLIKTNISNGSVSVVKENIFPLRSGDGTRGYFDILTQPANSSVVVLSQGVEGTGERDFIVLNGETGKIIRYGEIYEGDLNCLTIPFKDKTQRVLIYSCIEYFKTNPSETTKYLNNKLFTYDLVSGERKKILTIPEDQTFSCGTGYDSAHVYQYLGNNRVEIGVCSKNNELLMKEIVSF